MTEEYYTHQAPEELHAWVLDHPWPRGIFRGYGVKLLSVKVRGSTESGAFCEKYDNRTPLKLRCGVPIIKGQFGMGQKAMAIFEIRAADSEELKEALTELHEKTGIATWLVEKLKVYVPKKAAELTYTRINPDTHGVSLYLNTVDRNGRSKEWKSVSLHEQKELIGEFWDKLAHCTDVQETKIRKACAVQSKIKKRQIKLRKKNP